MEKDMKQTSIYLSREDLRKLKIIAANRETSINKLIREMIHKLIEEEGN